MALTLSGGLTLTGAPAVEPVTLTDVKAHLRIDSDHEDVLINSLMLTSRLHLESSLAIAMITQSWRLVVDAWPKSGQLDIPLAPLQSVTSVRVKPATGAAQLVPASSYLVDVTSRPPRIIWNKGALPKPGVAAAGIEIEFTAGFGAGASSVPAPLRHAILMLVAHWYEHRDPVEIGSSRTRVPEAVSDLVKPFRRMRL